MEAITELIMVVPELAAMVGVVPLKERLPLWSTYPPVSKIRPFAVMTPESVTVPEVAAKSATLLVPEPGQATELPVHQLAVLESQVPPPPPPLGPHV